MPLHIGTGVLRLGVGVFSVEEFCLCSVGIESLSCVWPANEYYIDDDLIINTTSFVGFTHVQLLKN